MILVVEDQKAKFDKLAYWLEPDSDGPEVAVTRAPDWATYQKKLREHDGRITAVCLDFVEFPSGDSSPNRTDADLRAEAARLLATGLRVVMWSDAARPERVPRGVLCVGSVAAARYTAEFLRGRSLPSTLPQGVSWGLWEPAPALAHLVALDILSQGYLAIAAADPAGGFTNEVADALRDGGSVGAECLAEAARPEQQAQIADPRSWFAPAREAIEQSGHKPSDLWAALSEDADAVTPIRQLYDTLCDARSRTAGEWHAIVAAAVAGFRQITDRGRL